MDNKLKILMLEDDPNDRNLVLHQLNKSELNFISEVVQTEDDFINTLRIFEPDIILSDYSLPSFTGVDAFNLKRKLMPDIPFIIVSGTIGEERAVELIKNGVTDYVLKDRIFALIPKIKRALHEAQERELIRKAGQALHLSESRLSKAQEVAHLGNWDMDFSTGTGFWSDECCRIYGLSPGENQQTFTNWLSFIHPDDLETTMSRIKDTSGALKETAFQHRIVRKDGTIRYLYTEGKMVCDSNNRPSGLYGIAHDVTELKLAEDSLRRSEMNLRAIFDNTGTGYLLLDNELNIIAFNRQFNRLVKLSFGFELQHRHNILNLMAPEMRGEFTRIFSMVISSGHMENETSRTQLNGELIWLSISGNSVADVNGKVVGLCVAVNDITERKIAEEEIKALNLNLEERIKHRTAELESVNKELEAFSYTVSHDLQAPLRVINGFSKIMLADYQDKLDEQGKEYLHVIGNSVLRMNQLIKDLLAFARVGKNPLAKSDVNMADLVNVIIMETVTSDTEFLPEVKLHDLPPALCDEGLIRQVWANLINNAVKYSKKKERPFIEIGGRRIDGYNTYYVKDNGAGFDMKYADRLFTVFKRLHSESEFEGTGVGLALVQRILTRHNGKIWAEAKVGEGATFYFTLP